MIFQKNIKEQQLNIWTSSELKPRTINSVISRFRKVISTKQLRRWKKQINVGRNNKKEKLSIQISAYTLDKFTEFRKRGIIHDIDITQWALQAQQQENLSGFKASHEVTHGFRRFKLAHQIVPRKIIKFITKKFLISKERSSFSL